MTSFLSCELPKLPKVAPRATKLKMSVYTPRTIINHKSLPERPFPGGSNGYSTNMISFYCNPDNVYLKVGFYFTLDPILYFYRSDLHLYFLTDYLIRLLHVRTGEKHLF